MDFSAVEIDQELKRFWAEVRAYIEANHTPELRGHIDVNEHDARLYRALGERGWNLPRWPRERGGAGLNALQERILNVELARSRAPLIGRNLTTLILPAVLEYGCEALQADIVPRVARGEVTFHLGYTEPDAGSDLAAIKTRSVRHGDEWVINGAKIFSTAAQHCDYSFLLTRSNPDAPKHRGLTVFLMPLKQPGVEIRPISTIGEERTNFVFYSDVMIPDYYRLGPVDGGWRVVSAPLAQEHGFQSEDPNHLAEINGQGAGYTTILGRVCDEARAWAIAAGRDGEQIVRRQVAQVALDTEASRNSPGMMGRITGVEWLQRDASDLIDLIGPDALINHADEGAIGEGVIEWAHRHSQGGAIFGGTTEIHRNMIAERILGLPRPPIPREAA